MTTAMTPLEMYIRMRWTWLGPREVHDPDGTYFEMRVAELPEFFVAASSAEEVRREKDDGLRAFIASYVERGEAPPLRPTWVVIPYDAANPPSGEQAEARRAMRPSRAAG